MTAPRLAFYRAIEAARTTTPPGIPADDWAALKALYDPYEADI